MKHIPRKRFGQNFLTDRGVIAAIVAAIAPREDDVMVEIGPGMGALTEPLLRVLKHLHVVEIDRDIVRTLQQRFSREQLTIHAADALRFDFSAIGPRFRLVGNLPYNISTPLLFHLCGFAEHIVDLHCMLQKEVVERMVAAPSTPAYGRLSVMLQCRFEMEQLFTVPAAAFHPAPKVESAVVRMVPLGALPYPAADEGLFAELVAAGFSQRRKTLRNTLRGRLCAEDFARLEIDPRMRAENLSVADFARLTARVRGKAAGD